MAKKALSAFLAVVFLTLGGRSFAVPNVVVSTDMCNDLDDVLAYTMLVELHVQRKIHLRGAYHSLRDSSCYKIYDYINSYYGVPVNQIQLGANLSLGRGAYSRNWLNYGGKVENAFKHTYRNPTILSTSAFYNAIFSKYPNATMIVTGMQTGESEALRTDPGIFNQATVLTMAGRFDKIATGAYGGNEFNIDLDPVSAHELTVGKEPLYYFGFEWHRICTGHPSIFPTDSPMYVAMSAYGRCRASWDLIPIVQAMNPSWFYMVDGTMTVYTSNGNNKFVTSGASDKWAHPTVSDGTITDYINGLLAKQTRYKPINMVPILQLLLLDE